MTGPEIIKEIIKLRHFASPISFTIDETSQLCKEIFKNFEIYGNTPIDELDPENTWIKSRHSSDIITIVPNNKLNNKNYDYIYSVKYLEKSRNTIGYTFQYKSWVIKPYLIIQHDWEPMIINDYHIYQNMKFIYKCKNCLSEGFRRFGDNYIMPKDKFLTCDEHTIKNIIE